jgi:hypothetical protein
MVSMDAREAFRVARIDRIDAGTLSVSGRAYDDLRIGDILSVQGTEPHGAEKRAQFTIARITTYGRGVSTLGRMVTGTLILRGSGGHTLQADVLLVRATRPAPKAAGTPLDAR